jgi:hypothetical protein
MHIHNKTFMIERISSCCDSLLIDDIVYVLMLSTTLVFFTIDVYSKDKYKNRI